MASAEITPQVIPVSPFGDVHLHLTIAEASILLKTLDYIDGDLGGPQDALYYISDALSHVGVEKANFKMRLYANLPRSEYGLWIIEE